MVVRTRTKNRTAIFYGGVVQKNEVKVVEKDTRVLLAECSNLANAQEMIGLKGWRIVSFFGATKEITVEKK